MPTRSADPENFDEFVTWLVSNGPSKGTCGTYFPAIRTYIRENETSISLQEARSPRFLEDAKRRVNEAISRGQSSINRHRLQRALLPALKHYAQFAKTHNKALLKTTRCPQTKQATGTQVTFEDLRTFVGRRGRLNVATIGGKTQFSVETAPSSLVIRPQKSSEKARRFSSTPRFFEHFNATGSFRTADYQGITFNSSYLLALIRDLLAEREQVYVAGDTPPEELEILAAPVTEREALRQSRVGQGRYREALLRLRRRCYVTGIDDPRFLQASHIRPWASSDNLARLDPHNGLLLAPHYDALFDDGFISFADDGHILLSPNLPPSIVDALGIDSAFVGTDLGPRTHGYLAYHRSSVFQTRATRPGSPTKRNARLSPGVGPAMLSPGERSKEC